MDWIQQYGRFCRDCEYWQTDVAPCRKSQGFMGTTGICHRFPPSRFCPENSIWTKPVTLDSDGCGEFKRIWHIQPETESPTIESKPQPKDLATVSESLLLNVKQVATLLGISPSHVYSMGASGQIPPPQKLGGSVRWNRQEIVSWIEAGCPPMNRWEYQKQNMSKNRSK